MKTLGDENEKAYGVSHLTNGTLGSWTRLQTSRVWDSKEQKEGPRSPLKAELGENTELLRTQCSWGLHITAVHFPLPASATEYLPHLETYLATMDNVDTQKHLLLIMVTEWMAHSDRFKGQWQIVSAWPLVLRLLPTTECRESQAHTSVEVEGNLTQRGCAPRGSLDR